MNAHQWSGFSLIWAVFGQGVRAYLTTKNRFSMRDSGPLVRSVRFPAWERYPGMQCSESHRWLHARASICFKVYLTNLTTRLRKPGTTGLFVVRFTFST